MTLNTGTVVLAPIVPNDSADTYPSHWDYYGAGGFRAVADIATRDAITADRRLAGMLVGVINDPSGAFTIYYLGTGLTNSDWIPLLGGFPPVFATIRHDGWTTPFTTFPLTHTVLIGPIIVALDGVIQSTGYTVSGGLLTFSFSVSDFNTVDIWYQ